MPEDYGGHAAGTLVAAVRIEALRVGDGAQAAAMDRVGGDARRLLPRLDKAKLTLRIEQAELARLQAGLPPALLAARILSPS